jgi:hypothetical protein
MASNSFVLKARRPRNSLWNPRDLRFSRDVPLPLGLIARIVRLKVRQDKR